jgi:hypothetical protein
VLTINLGYIHDKAFINVYLGRLKIFGKTFDVSKKITKPKPEFKDIIKAFKNIEDKIKLKIADIRDILERVRGDIDIKSYSVLVDVGVGNSALTGIATGTIYATIGLVKAIIGNIFDVGNPNIIVTPRYDKKIFDISAGIVIKARLCKVHKTAKFLADKFNL